MKQETCFVKMHQWGNSNIVNIGNIWGFKIKTYGMRKAYHVGMQNLGSTVFIKISKTSLE